MQAWSCHANVATACKSGPCMQMLSWHAKVVLQGQNLGSLVRDRIQKRMVALRLLRKGRNLGLRSVLHPLLDLPIWVGHALSNGLREAVERVEAHGLHQLLVAV